MSFNLTNKDPRSSVLSAAKGGSSRRRDVPLKGSPIKPVNNSKALVLITPLNSRFPLYSESFKSTPYSVFNTFTLRGGSSVSSLILGDSSRGNRFADFKLPKREPET